MEVGAEVAAFADDDGAAHNGGTGVNGDAILQRGMAFLAAQVLATRERTGHQTSALIYFDVVADLGRLAHDGYLAGR